MSCLLSCRVSCPDYQIKVGNRYNEKWGLQKKCIYFQADFMNLPVPDNSFDAAYEIEATCHAPDKAACYERIFNALKPGGLFAGYEWVVTDKVSSQSQMSTHFIRTAVPTVRSLISRFPFFSFFSLSMILPTASTSRSAKESRSAMVCL